LATRSDPSDLISDGLARDAVSIRAAKVGDNSLSGFHHHDNVLPLWERIDLLPPARNDPGGGVSHENDKLEKTYNDLLVHGLSSR
jgi:hypothetical protein